MKGYSSTTLVANYLGKTLTAAQQTEATTLLGFAEDLIDRETHRGWLLGPITNEIYDLWQPVIYLRHAPVTSVQSVQTRTLTVADTLQTLTSLVDYELIDANRGEVVLVSGYWSRHSIALVSYTPNLPVPQDISQAATLIAAYSMTTSIYPDRFGVAQALADQHTRVVYTDDGVSIQIPDTAQAIMDGYRLPLVV